MDMNDLVTGYAIRTIKDGKFANPPCSPWFTILPNWTKWPCIIAENENDALSLIDGWVKHRGDPNYECELIKVSYTPNDFKEYYQTEKLNSNIKFEVIKSGLNKE